LINRNGNYDSISHIDSNGNFCGEAKFQTMQEAQAYWELYKEKINKLLAYGRAKSRESYKIFELDNKTVKEINKKKYGLNYRLSPLLW